MISLLLAISSISSSQADYDGNELKLHGNVVIEHPLGKMESEEAVLEKPAEAEQPDSFNAIHLAKTVLIELNNRGKVRCDIADFDLKTLTAGLKAKDGEKIFYTHFLQNNQPFELQSLSAKLKFQPGKDANSPLFDALSAMGSVEITYGDGFGLRAEAADYAKPVLTVFSPDGTPCLLTHAKDSVQADRIQLFPEESKIILDHPKGSFHSLGQSEETELAFKCDALTWDQKGQIVHFESAVEISEPTMGTAQANSGVATFAADELATFELSGDVLLSKTDERCATANYLIYTQNAQTVVLQAAPGQRVLFWDATKGLAISAAEVQIARDPLTQEEIIRGVGNVRMRFSSAEYALLSKLFPSHALPEAHGE